MSGVKEALLSQTAQTNRLEEKFSSQLQSLQASIQLHDASFTKFEDKIEDCLKKVAWTANSFDTVYVNVRPFYRSFGDFDSIMTDSIQELSLRAKEHLFLRCKA